MTLILASVFITLVVIGGYAELRIFGEAFGSECEKSESWTMGGYRIQRYKCLGWAGPHNYRADLYKNGKRIDESKYLIDSCFFKFRPEDDLYLEFNICDKSINEIRAKKRQLNIDKVNSVDIKDCKTGISKALGEKERQKFINDWNKARISDHRDRAPIFYSGNKFEILVSLGNDKIKFYGFNHLIADEFNWVYYINKNETSYFEQLMNGKYR